MAAGRTYTPIARTTLSTASSTVTFDSISGSYTDLAIITNAGMTSIADMLMRFNNDSGSNYSNTFLWGAVSPSVGSARYTNQSAIFCDYYSNFESPIQNTHILNVMNYANSNTYKTALMRGTKGGTAVDTTVGLWRSTASINRIDLISSSNTFVSGSTFTLYGIAAA